MLVARTPGIALQIYVAYAFADAIARPEESMSHAPRRDASDGQFPRANRNSSHIASCADAARLPQAEFASCDVALR